MAMNCNFEEHYYMVLIVKKLTSKLLCNSKFKSYDEAADFQLNLCTIPEVENLMIKITGNYDDDNDDIFLQNYVKHYKNLL